MQRREGLLWNPSVPSLWWANAGQWRFHFCHGSHFPPQSVPGLACLAVIVLKFAHPASVFYSFVADLCSSSNISVCHTVTGYGMPGDSPSPTDASSATDTTYSSSSSGPQTPLSGAFGFDAGRPFLGFPSPTPTSGLYFIRNQSFEYCSPAD